MILEEPYSPDPPPAPEREAESPPEGAPAPVPLFQRQIAREPSLEDFLRGLGMAGGREVDDDPPEEDFLEPEEEPLPSPEPVVAEEAPVEVIRPADAGAYAIKAISSRTQQSFPLLSQKSLA